MRYCTCNMSWYRDSDTKETSPIIFLYQNTLLYIVSYLLTVQIAWKQDRTWLIKGWQFEDCLLFFSSLLVWGKYDFIFVQFCIDSLNEFAAHHCQQSIQTVIPDDLFVCVVCNRRTKCDRAMFCNGALKKMKSTLSTTLPFSLLQASCLSWHAFTTLILLLHVLHNRKATACG